MEPLADTRHSDKEGTTIHLLARVKEKALVVSFTGKHFSGFEVHKIKVQKEGTYKIGKQVVHHTEKECYRTAAEFGFYAWHYPNIELALIDHPEFKPFSTLLKGKLQRLLHESLGLNDNLSE